MTDVTRTFVFIDLVSASLGPDDHLVKTIGDEVMLTSPDPAAAVAMTKAIIERTHAEQHFPQTRAGLHHGAAVERQGDYLGGAVNLAARVAAFAKADQTLATADVADTVALRAPGSTEPARSGRGSWSDEGCRYLLCAGERRLSAHCMRQVGPERSTQPRRPRAFAWRARATVRPSCTYTSNGAGTRHDRNAACFDR